MFPCVLLLHRDTRTTLHTMPESPKGWLWSIVWWETRNKQMVVGGGRLRAWPIAWEKMLSPAQLEGSELAKTSWIYSLWPGVQREEEPAVPHIQSLESPGFLGLGWTRFFRLGLGLSYPIHTDLHQGGAEDTASCLFTHSQDDSGAPRAGQPTHLECKLVLSHCGKALEEKQSL